jgi:L-fuconolactonase
MPRIDAHHHLWRLARGDYAWLRADDPALAPIARDWLPDELAPLLARHGVSRTVLVQAADTVAETAFLLELAERHPVVAGVVGWVDLAQADAVPALERLAAHPAFKGVRPMLQDLPDPAWIADAPRADALDALERLGLRFDALVKTPHLDALRRFVDTRPGLPVVIDHAGKPPLAAAWHDAPMRAWRRGMASLAAFPQVHCKLSGLVTELPAGAAAGPIEIAERLRPVVDALIGWFGPSRLMWGSDWPVLTLRATYDDWVAASDVLLAGLLSPDERAEVRQGTAARFYGIAA